MNSFYLIGIIIAAILTLTIIFFSLQEESTFQSYADQIISECGDDINCTIDSLRKVSEEKDKDLFIQTFNEVISKYEKIENYCHEKPHHLAYFFYDYVGNVTEAISYVDRKCGGSVYHGIVERFFVTQASKGISVDEIQITNVCPEDSNNPNDVDRLECIHGIGHGLTKIFGVPAALDRCNEFDPGWDHQRCGSGIFMENQVVYYNSKEGYFDENDIYFPCNKIDEEFAPYCYNYQSSYILSKNNFVIAQSFRVCDEVTPEKFVKFCYEGVGRQMAQVVFEDMKRGEIICNQGQATYQPYCHTAIALAFADHKSLEEGLEYCKIAPEDAKFHCYNELGRWIGMINSSDEFRVEKCSMAENEEYFDVCVQAKTESLRFS